MKHYLLIPIVVFVCLFVSCSKEKQRETETTSQIETLQGLEGADNQTIASILVVSEAELNSILSGEVQPSTEFVKRVDEVYNYSVDNGSSFKKLRAAYDPDFAWCDHILLSPWVHPWWFWIITGIFLWFTIFRNIILSFIRHSNAIYSDGLYLGVAKLSRLGLLVEGLVFLVAYLFSVILQ